MSEQSPFSSPEEEQSGQSLESIFATHRSRGGKALYKALIQSGDPVATVADIVAAIEPGTISSTASVIPITNFLSSTIHEVNSKLQEIEAGQIVPVVESFNVTSGYLYVTEPNQIPEMQESLRVKMLTYAHEKTAEGYYGFPVGNDIIFRYYDNPDQRIITYPRLWAYLKKGETPEADKLYFTRSESLAVLFARLLQTGVVTQLDRHRFTAKYAQEKEQEANIKRFANRLHKWMQHNSLPYSVTELEGGYVLRQDNDNETDVRKQAREVLSGQIIAECTTADSELWKQLGPYQVAFFEAYTDQKHPVYAVVIQPDEAETQCYHVNRKQYEFLKYVANKGGYVENSIFEQDKASNIAPEDTYSTLAVVAEMFKKTKRAPVFSGVSPSLHVGYVLFNDDVFRHIALNEQANAPDTNRAEYSMVDIQGNILQTLRIIAKESVKEVELQSSSAALLQIKKGTYQVTIEISDAQYNELDRLLFSHHHERQIISQIYQTEKVRRTNWLKMFSRIEDVGKQMKVTVQPGKVGRHSVSFPLLTPTVEEEIIQEQHGEIVDQYLEQERRLITAAKAGDEHAWEALFDRIQKRVYRYFSYRITDPQIVEDLAGEVILKITSTLPNYQFTDKPFAAWVNFLAHSSYVDHVRKVNRNPIAGFEDVYATSVTDDMDENLIRGFQEGQLQNALNQLTPEYQAVILHRFFYGETIEETARKLGITKENVKVRQFRAIAVMREFFKTR